MNRRSGAGPKLIGAAVVVVIVIYGLYSFNDIQSKLRTAEEKTERLRQQYDSLSAQLQVVYEHKSRLERSLQTEKTEHKKTRDDLIARKSEADAKFATQKQELMNRVSALNQEYKMLQSQHDDLQGEYTRLQESLNKLQEDHKQQLEQHNLEFRQMQQDKENDIAKLKDELANLDRRFKDKLGRLQGLNQQLSNQLQQANQEMQFQQQRLRQEVQEKQDLTEKLQKIQLENQYGRQQAGLNANQQVNQNQNQQLNQNQFNQQNQFGQQLNQNQNQGFDANQQLWADKGQQKVQNQPLQQNLNDNNNQNFNANVNQNQGFNNNLNNNQFGANFGDQNQQVQRNQFDNGLNVNNNVNLQNNNQNLGAGGDLNQFGQNQFDQNKLRNDIAVNGGQDPLNMQIALPGQDKHPGYHEVKDVDPADKLHHQNELAQSPNENENLGDAKGPVIMQQVAPNLQAKNISNDAPNMVAGGNFQVAPPRQNEPDIHQVAAPIVALKDSASAPGANKSAINDNLQPPDVRNDLQAADNKEGPVQAIPPPDLDKHNVGDPQFGDIQNDQFQAGGAPDGLAFQAPQLDMKDHNMDTFRNDKLRNHPEILGAGGINQGDVDAGRIKAPVALDANQQIPLPMHDGHVRNNNEDDDDEDDKYDDGNDEGQINNPQGQVLPPNLEANQGLAHGLDNQQENQVPVPNNNNQHDLLDRGQPVADHNADYDKGQPVPQGDDNEGDYQEDEDEDNRGRMGGRDFQ